MSDTLKRSYAIFPYRIPSIKMDRQTIKNDSQQSASHFSLSALNFHSNYDHYEAESTDFDRQCASKNWKCMPFDHESIKFATVFALRKTCCDRSLINFLFIVRPSLSLLFIFYEACRNCFKEVYEVRLLFHAVSDRNKSRKVSGRRNTFSR